VAGKAWRRGFAGLASFPKTSIVSDSPGLKGSCPDSTIQRLAMSIRPRTPRKMKLKNLRCPKCGCKLNPLRKRCKKCAQKL
jgi:hypothetical protein